MEVVHFEPICTRCGRHIAWGEVYKTRLGDGAIFCSKCADDVTAEQRAKKEPVHS